jgi:Zn-dependent protease with chaperone function
MVAACSVVFTYALTLTLGFAFLAFACLQAVAMLSHDNYSVVGFLLLAFVFVVGGTILWSLVPRKEKLDIQGVLLDLSKQPRLRAEIETIARAMKEPMPTEVYLVAAANAAAAQRRPLLGKKKRRILIIGLPLLQMLTVSQMRAVLVHEFAHFYGGDTSLGPWVFRARNSMLRVMINLTQKSGIMSVLTRWAVIAVIYLIVIGGLTLYWKVFIPLTQYISRRQEFGCDELACHLAGSESLAEGLCNVNRASSFPAYFNQIVMPVVSRGFHPSLADGFQRFVNSPAIQKTVSVALEVQLAKTTTDPNDSHPPLSARVQKARALAIPDVQPDQNAAITLIDDLQALERQLLSLVAPALQASTLQSIHWDAAGSEVYVPLWRSQTAPFQTLFSGKTIAELPATLADLATIAGQLKDPPGILSTREHRLQRALGVINASFTLALIDHGWRLHIQPGECYLQHNEEKIEPAKAIADLQKGKLTPASWVAFCSKLGIGSWPVLSAPSEQQL